LDLKGVECCYPLNYLDIHGTLGKLLFVVLLFVVVLQWILKMTMLFGAVTISLSYKRGYLHNPDKWNLFIFTNSPKVKEKF